MATIEPNPDREKLAGNLANTIVESAATKANGYKIPFTKGIPDAEKPELAAKLKPDIDRAIGKLSQNPQFAGMSDEKKGEAIASELSRKNQDGSYEYGNAAEVFTRITSVTVAPETARNKAIEAAPAEIATALKKERPELVNAAVKPIEKSDVAIAKVETPVVAPEKAPAAPSVGKEVQTATVIPPEDPTMQLPPPKGPIMSEQPSITQNSLLSEVAKGVSDMATQIASAAQEMIPPEMQKAFAALADNPAFKAASQMVQAALKGIPAVDMPGTPPVSPLETGAVNLAQNIAPPQPSMGGR